MRNHRHQLLSLISSVAVTGLVGWGTPSYAKLQVPIERPVSEPLAPDILQAEVAIKNVLRIFSEDRPLTLEEIVVKDPALQTMPADKLNIVVLDLLWTGSIEEVGEKTFRLIRSGHG